MWVELAFAFIVGTSCIALTLYHIRLLAKEDEQEDAAAIDAVGYQSMEDDSLSGQIPDMNRGEIHLSYGTGRIVMVRAQRMKVLMISTTL